MTFHFTDGKVSGQRNSVPWANPHHQLGAKCWHEGDYHFPSLPWPSRAAVQEMLQPSHRAKQSKASADSCWGESRRSGVWASALCCDEVPWKLSMFPGRASGPGHCWGTKSSQVLAKKLHEHCKSHNTRALQCCKQYASYPGETFLNPLFQIKHTWSQALYKCINPWHLWEGNNRVIVSNTRAVPFCNVILPLANII